MDEFQESPSDRKITNSVEIETITKHQFPWAEGFGLERVDRAHQSKSELAGVTEVSAINGGGIGGSQKQCIAM